MTELCGVWISWLSVLGFNSAELDDWTQWSWISWLSVCSESSFYRSWWLNSLEFWMSLLSVLGPNSARTWWLNSVELDILVVCLCWIFILQNLMTELSGVLDVLGICSGINPQNLMTELSGVGYPGCLYVLNLHSTEMTELSGVLDVLVICSGT